MPYYSSNILRVLYSSDKEIEEALGDDSRATVRGNRRLARKNSYQEHIENGLEATRGSEIPALTTERIVSGGSDRDRDKDPPPVPSISSHHTQTQGSVKDIPRAPMSFFLTNVGVLRGRPRDIQLQKQEFLGAVTPGSEVRYAFKRDETGDPPTGTFTTPDKFPLSVVIEETTETRKENPIPDIKLVPEWEYDINRQEEAAKVRDSEWLQVSSSDEGNADKMEAVEARALAKKIPIASNPYSQSLAKSMSLLIIVSSVGGRWPFSSYLQSGKWWKYEVRKKTPAYVMFTITSLIHSLVSIVSMLNLAKFAYAENRHNISRIGYIQIERLEFDKYWHFAFWTYIMACFVIFWNTLIVVEGGRFLSELMSRWSFAVSGLHYNPTLRIRQKLCWSTFGFGVYAIGMIVLFQTGAAVAVPGTAGVLGFLLFRDITPSIRFSSRFYWVRLIGLIYHLYTVYAAKVAMLFLITYAKILENTARNWNLRFALRFGMIGRQKKAEKDYQVVLYRTQIPMEKLLVEHRVLTAFCRHTAAIYHTILNVYVVTKGTEMVLFIYRSFLYLIIPDTSQFNETDFKLKETGERITYKDTDAQKMMSCFIVTGSIFFGWLFTCVSISDCGDAIMNGYGFVRRHGLVFCRGAKERLAIQSLAFQYSPVIEYYMIVVTPFKRKFVLGLFTWILVFSLGLLSFTPFQLQKTRISICETNPITGEYSCSSVTLSNIQSAVIRSTPKPVLTTTSKTSPTTAPPITTFPTIRATNQTTTANQTTLTTPMATSPLMTETPSSMTKTSSSVTEASSSVTQASLPSTDTTEISPSSDDTTDTSSSLTETTDTSSLSTDMTEVSPSSDETTDASSSLTDTTDTSSLSTDMTEVSPSSDETTDTSSSLTETTDESSLSTDMTEISPSSDETTDKSSSLTETTDASSLSTDMTEISPSSDETTDTPSSLTETTEISHSSDETTDTSSSLTETTEISHSSDETTDTSSSLTETTEISHSSDETTDTSSSLSETTDASSLSTETTKIPRKSDGTTDTSSSLSETTDKFSSPTETTESSSLSAETTEKLRPETETPLTGETFPSATKASHSTTEISALLAKTSPSGG